MIFMTVKVFAMPSYKLGVDTHDQLLTGYIPHSIQRIYCVAKLIV